MLERRTVSTRVVVFCFLVAAGCAGGGDDEDTNKAHLGQAPCGDGKCEKDKGEDFGQCPDDCEPEPICGDTVCDADAKETCDTCPADCGSCTKCGNDACEMGETPASCPADCHCGDGLCDAASGETVASCSADCHCGNGSCEPGETCGSCPSDCKPGGTIDCMTTDLKANCCGQNADQQACYACNNVYNCTQEEYDAYCHRFDPNPNAWDDLLRGWVAGKCGISPDQVTVTDHYECTDNSTCTTYTCQL